MLNSKSNTSDYPPRISGGGNPLISESIDFDIHTGFIDYSTNPVQL